MTLAVNISNQQQSAGVETTFTENVSAHGARILSTRHWRPGDRLLFALLPGAFRANARVSIAVRSGTTSSPSGLSSLNR